MADMMRGKLKEKTGHASKSPAPTEPGREGEVDEEVTRERRTKRRMDDAESQMEQLTQDQMEDIYTQEEREREAKEEQEQERLAVE